MYPKLYVFNIPAMDFVLVGTMTTVIRLYYTLEKLHNLRCEVAPYVGANHFQQPMMGGGNNFGGDKKGGTNIFFLLNFLMFL